VPLVVESASGVEFAETECRGGFVPWPGRAMRHKGDLVVNKTTAIAAAAAALFLSGAPALAAHHEEAKVKCEGVNACKGQGACSGAGHECGGQNGCKGQGFLELTQAECDAAKAKAAEKK
jgi:hypothetical protein